ncbi:hypothetical protein CONPUDRAFT_37666, partial [Coniophora puteana RWD-64-598 SS2]
LRWIAGHEGVDGNEQADLEAKAAASSPRQSSNPRELPTFLRRKTLPRSAAALKQDYRTVLYERWKEQWLQSARSRHLVEIDSSLPSGKY